MYFTPRASANGSGSANAFGLASAFGSGLAKGTGSATQDAMMAKVANNKNFEYFISM